jgi:hypothetical protein
MDDAPIRVFAGTCRALAVWQDQMPPSGLFLRSDQSIQWETYAEVDMADARIFQARKSAMQSGRGKAGRWVLQIASSAERTSDPLMGWTSVDDMSGQIKMTFDTRAQAVAFAKREGLTFSVEEARERKRLVKSYAENFSTDRKQPWTH